MREKLRLPGIKSYANLMVEMIGLCVLSNLQTHGKISHELKQYEVSSDNPNPAPANDTDKAKENTQSSIQHVNSNYNRDRKNPREILD